MSIKILKKGELLKKVAIIMGTRPGIIKMAPLAREFKSRGIDNFIIHTGQHYSENMDLAFFNDLEISAPKYRVDSTRKYSTHGEQTSEMISGVEKVLLETRPKVVLVCGDANTNLAAGLAARKLGMVVGHVESGLRSHDWSMPEEHNRIILDHISELLFAPTQETCRNLVADNVRGSIYLTGNTIVDSTLRFSNIAEQRGGVLEEYGLERGKYALFTSHREENVDIKERLSSLVDAIGLLVERVGLKVLFPAHPRTRKRLEEFGLMEKVFGLGSVNVIEPVGYMSSLMLIKNASVVLTDSGGIQEEACILHTPCVTLRDNTERPETIDAGSNRLAGTNPEDIVASAVAMSGVDRKWEIPFGDGRAAMRIAGVVADVLENGAELVDVSVSNRQSLNEKFSMWEVE